MKTLLSLILMTISFSVSAFENRACLALMDEFKIPTTPRDNTIRKFLLVGKSNQDKECRLQFLPDFCTFQLEAPLEKVEMYYLMDTEASLVKIRYREGENFFMKTSTREEAEGFLGLLSKELDFEKRSDGAYGVKYRVKTGRVFKNELRSFDCVVRPGKLPGQR